MSSVSGIYRNGRVELAAPVDWPEGLEVEVVSALPAAGPDDSVPCDHSWHQTFTPEEAVEIAVVRKAIASGVEGPKPTDGGWPQTAEDREALIARMESREPLEFTPEDISEIAAARRAVKDYTLDAMRKQWETGT